MLALLASAADKMFGFDKLWIPVVLTFSRNSSRSGCDALILSHSPTSHTDIVDNLLRTSIILSMGVGRNFSRGRGKVDILLIFFVLLTMQWKGTFTKRVALSTAQRKCSMLRQQPQKCASLTAMVLFTHICSTPYKPTRLPQVMGATGSQEPVLGISVIQRTGCWLKSGVLKW